MKHKKKVLSLVVAAMLATTSCEEAIVEGITGNTDVREQTKPSTEEGIGTIYSGSLAGTAWRMTSQTDWPNTMLIIAFGSNDKYSIQLVGINPNKGWPNGLNALQMSGGYTHNNGILSVEARNHQGGRITGLLRKVNNSLCWDVPIYYAEEASTCGIIMVRVKK